MRPKVFALVAGFIMLALGILAFVPALNVAPSAGFPSLVLDNSYTLFLGYVPWNLLNKIALIVFGFVGIAVATLDSTRALPRSIRWSRVVFYVMGVLAFLGLFPQTNTLFGYMPLYGWDIIAHAVFAILGAYFGYALSSRVPDQKMAPSHSHVASVR